MDIKTAQNPSGQKPFAWLDKAASWVGQRWDEYTGSAQVREANLHSQELAKYGYEQEKQMIREQNEYNTPKNQMLRYQEAGLNPHLIYGQGTPGNQTAIAKYNAPDVKAAPRIDYLGMTLQALQGYQQIVKTIVDTDNVKAHTALTKEETGKVSKEVQKIIQDISASKWEQQKSKGLYPSQKAIQVNQTQIQAQELKKLAFENLFREKGINPNDPMPFRFISRLIDWLISQPEGMFFNKNWKNESFKIPEKR